jgi:hypothetical protein
MKLTLKEFERYIKIIKELRDNADKFSEALTVFTEERPACINGREEGLMVELLEKLMGDTFNIISWWIYEKNWGTRKKFDYKIGGKVIKTKTIKDLYNLLMITYEQKDIKDL